MKKYIIFWETDYCDNFPERMGEIEIEANSEEEAKEKFYQTKPTRAIIYRIQEVKN